jgi:hypothetical protein
MSAEPLKNRDLFSFENSCDSPPRSPSPFQAKNFVFETMNQGQPDTKPFTLP